MMCKLNEKYVYLFTFVFVFMHFIEIRNLNIAIDTYKYIYFKKLLYCFWNSEYCTCTVYI